MRDQNSSVLNLVSSFIYGELTRDQRKVKLVSLQYRCLSDQKLCWIENFFTGVMDNSQFLSNKETGFLPIEYGNLKI